MGTRRDIHSTAARDVRNPGERLLTGLGEEDSYRSVGTVSNTRPCPILGFFGCLTRSPFLYCMGFVVLINSTNKVTVELVGFRDE